MLFPIKTGSNVGKQMNVIKTAIPDVLILNQKYLVMSVVFL